MVSCLKKLEKLCNALTTYIYVCVSGNIHMVEKIVDRALTSLNANGVEINREMWFQEAIEAEKAGAVNCCQAIIKAIIGSTVEEEDRKQTWIDDAEFVSLYNFLIANILIF